MKHRLIILSLSDRLVKNTEQYRMIAWIKVNEQSYNILDFNDTYQRAKSITINFVGMLTCQALVGSSHILMWW